MRGTGDHTWVDLEVMTQEQFERFEEMENKTKSEKIISNNKGREVSNYITFIDAFYILWWGIAWSRC